MTPPLDAGMHRIGSGSEPSTPVFATFASDVPAAPPVSRLLPTPAPASQIRLPTTPPQGGMIYQAYQAHSDLLWPLRMVAKTALPALCRARDVPGEDMALRKLAAACQVFRLPTLTHAPPPFRIATVTIGERQVEVREEEAFGTPFGTLLHFRKEMPDPGPRVLILAPMSGH